MFPGIVTFLFLAACSSGPFFTNPSPEPDSIVEDSVIVVTIGIEEPLDLSSFNAQTILVNGSKTGPLRINLRQRYDSAAIAFAIRDSLHRNEWIDIILSDKLRLTTGKTVPNGIRWGFWVPSQRWQFDRSEDDSVVYVNVDDLPEPMGGIAAIQRNVIYPEEAKRAGIQGTVYLEAFINEAGIVGTVNVIQGIGGGCDEAAALAVRNTRFLPGRQKGVPVKVRMSIPIRFRLAR